MEIAYYGLDALSEWSRVSQSWASSESMSGEPFRRGFLARGPTKKTWREALDRSQLYPSLATFPYLINKTKDPRPAHLTGLSNEAQMRSIL